MWWKLQLCLLLSYLAVITAGFNYDGFKIYDVNAKNALEKNLLLQLSENESYDFFDLPKDVKQSARVMVAPSEQNEFETLLNKYGLNYKIVTDDVETTLENDRLQNGIVRSISPPINRGVSFNQFMRFAEINNYLDELAKNYPQRVKVKTVGTSYEGRAIKTITISNGDGAANKKAIFLDAGIHAREWIAPAAALYVINQLVENYAANAHLLQNYEWIVLPVVNPDGYEYTHLYSRMWRKTRKPVTASCYGTDANRNFDFHWGEVGASALSCADTFKGQTAFSEPETIIVRDIMHSLTGRGKMYLTLHSYGNYLLYPWGYTSALPSTWRDIDEVAQAGAAAIRSATGTSYTVGSSTNVLYAAAGGSDDYALAKAGIPVSITMELPAGGTGFNPSTSQIKPFVEETWIGIKAMAAKVISKY